MNSSANFENRSVDVFKIRYSLDSDYTEKDLHECEDNIKKKMKRIIDKETKQPHFRSINYVEELLQEIQNSISEQLEKLKAKNPLAYKLRLDEQKKKVEQFRISLEELYDETISILAMIDNDQSIDRDFIFLMSDAQRQLIKTNKVLFQALAKERVQRPSRSTKGLSKIIDVFTAMFLVMLRLIELEKHWSSKKEERNNMLKDMLLMDLDTLGQYTRSLEISDIKSRKIEIDEELMMALWG